jgi:hypothetical protein
MANWKVIALVSGNIEAVSGPAAQDRPGAHEWVVWEGPAADKAEAVQSTEKANPTVHSFLRVTRKKKRRAPATRQQVPGVSFLTVAKWTW